MLGLALSGPGGTGLLHPSNGPCDKSRKVHIEPWGVITAGPPGTNYTQDSHCEWLIKGTFYFCSALILTAFKHLRLDRTVVATKFKLSKALRPAPLPKYCPCRLFPIG